VIAMVLGSANTLYEDSGRARALLRGHDPVVIACNHAARDWPGRVDHWATMHPDQLPGWAAQRARQGYTRVGRYWYARHRICPAVIEATPVESWGGSSGLLCVTVAFELGCERIILAGVPMLKMAKHFDDQRNWDEARAYHRAWEAKLERMRGRVKSLSGWTRELLGEPTEDWLFGDAERTAA
jgi:hypothetical protein